MRLYKYVQPERVDVLLNGVIRFTQPSLLNDLFESAPPFGGILPSWVEDILQSAVDDYGRLYLARASVHAVSGLNLPDLATAALNIATLSQVSRVQLGRHLRRWQSTFVARVQPGAGFRAQETLSERFGILSLSETATNVLMWSHYADSHRGLVFEVEVEEGFPGRTSLTGLIGTPQKVIYDADRPAWFFYDPLGKPFQNRIKDIFLRKNIQWQYEKEWRLVYPLTNPRRYPHTISSNIHLFPLVRAGIKRVILGARASDQTIRSVETAVTSVPELNHVTLWRCRPSETAYELLADRFVAGESSWVT
ncbi:MAG TPA: DUF2971 domain-containing protein [Thermoanaerobaculia bacterium]